MEDPHGPGGFHPPPLPPPLLSPPLSSQDGGSAGAASPRQAAAATATVTATLPVARSHPIKAGSSKESMVIDHVDKMLLDISGKFERRFDSKISSTGDGGVDSGDGGGGGGGSGGVNGGSQGYSSFSQLALDLGRVIDVIWISATPSLQIPYLMSISLSLIAYLEGFDFAPRSLFPLLRKLDVALASLLTMTNLETHEALFGGGGESDSDGGGRTRGFTITEKVRLTGIVGQLRVAVAKAAKGGGTYPAAAGDDDNDRDDAAMQLTDTDADTDADTGAGANADDNARLASVELQSAKTFELTLNELGDHIDAAPRFLPTLIGGGR